MRKPAFADSFYPSDERNLRYFVLKAIDSAKVKPNAVGDAVSYVSPHAGYIYSGNTAGYTYRALSQLKNLKDLDSVIFVGPNHTGVGTSLSVSMEDWETPLGVVKNDLELSKAIVGSSELISSDESAHSGEHSIEVQLPFLQCVATKRCSFICMGDQSPRSSELLTTSIVGAVRRLNRKAVVIASSDMDHYESADVAKGKDMKLITAIKGLEVEKFNALVGELRDSTCGFGPITVAAMFAKAQGKKEGLLLDYSNSGDQTNDYSSVVAYSSIAFV